MESHGTKFKPNLTFEVYEKVLGLISEGNGIPSLTISFRIKNLNSEKLKSPIVTLTKIQQNLY